jgi:hypothetical protein
MATNSAVRNRGYGLVEQRCLLENSECLAVPVRRGRRGKLKNGRASESDTDPMGYNRVVDLITSVLVPRAFLVEPRNLGTLA